MDDLLTVKEAAELLKLTPMTVYRAVEEGRLQHLRFGRTIRIPREALNSFLKTPEPTAPKPANPRTHAPVTRI